MADTRYILSSNTPSTVTPSGTYDFRGGVLALPTGSVTPTATGPNIVFIKNSGVISLWNGSIWKTLSISIGGIPAVLQEAPIWIDIDAGSTTGQSPLNLGTLGSNGILGDSAGDAFDDPVIALNYGRNCWYMDAVTRRTWLFPAAGTGISESPRINLTTMHIFTVSGTIGTATRVLGGLAHISNGSNFFSVRQSLQGGSGALSILRSTTSTPLTPQYNMDTDVGKTKIVFASLSGSQDDPPTTYNVSGVVEVNPSYTGTFPPAGHPLSGTVAGYVGTTPTTSQAWPVAHMAFAVWPKVLTTSEKQSIQTYYESLGVTFS